MECMDIVELLKARDDETLVLAKVLYRNKNQHGCSQFYVNLSKVRKLLKRFSSENIIILEKESAKALMSLNKPSSTDVSSASSLLSDVRGIVAQGCEVMTWSIASSRAMLDQLSQKVFVPLMSMCLGMISRIFHSTAEVTKRFYRRQEAMVDILKHVGVLQPRFTATISSLLSEAFLSTEAKMMLLSVDKSIFPMALEAELLEGNSSSTSTLISTTVAVAAAVESWDPEDMGEEIMFS